MSHESDVTDRRLVDGALRRDPRALDLLVARLRCVPRILSTFNQRTGGWMKADDLGDLAQDVVVSLWRRLESYSGEAALETWIYGFCFRAFMNAARKRQGRGEFERIDGPRVSADGLPSSFEYEHLYQALDSLDDEEKRVIRLKHFDELTFAEIGTRLGIPLNTAKTVYYRGLRHLSEHLRRSSKEVPS